MKYKTLPGMDLQQTCHFIAIIGEKLHAMHKRHKVFKEKDSGHRSRMFNIAFQAPEFYPAALALIEALKKYFRFKKQVVADEDLLELLSEAEVYRKVLDEAYAQAKMEIACVPSPARNGHFFAHFKRAHDLRMVHRPRLHGHRTANANAG